MFLYPLNRFLVYSTHRPLSIDALANNFIGAANAMQDNGRFVSVVNMPETYDQLEMQSISLSCSGVTKAEIALYGGIPAFLFNSRNEENLITLNKKFFNLVDPSWPSTSHKDLLFKFVTALYDGVIQPSIQIFDRFSTYRKGGSRFPLYYVSLILRRLNTDLGLESVNAVVKLIDTDLAANVQTQNSGKEWETIIQIAILLKLIRYEVGPDEMRLTLFDKFFGKVSYVKFQPIPPQLSTLEESKSFIFGVMERETPCTVVLFVPSSADFEVVDGVIGYKSETKTSTSTYQAKAGQELPNANSTVPEWIDTAVWIRGKTGEKESSPIFGGVQVGQWNILTKAEVEELLGYSMKTLMCMNWEAGEQITHNLSEVSA